MTRRYPCPGCGRVRNSSGPDVICKECKGNPDQVLPAEEVLRLAEVVEAEARKRFPLAMVYLALSADLKARRSA